MTPGTIVLLRPFFPMALEASSVTERRCFEGSFHGLISCLAALERDRYVCTLICHMTGSAYHPLVVALVVREVAGKLKLHRLLVLFWKRPHVTRGEARARVRMAYGADTGCCATENRWRGLAVTPRARIMIRVAFDAGLSRRCNYIRSGLHRDSVAIRTIQFGPGRT